MTQGLHTAQAISLHKQSLLQRHFTDISQTILLHKYFKDIIEETISLHRYFKDIIGDNLIHVPSSLSAGHIEMWRVDSGKAFHFVKCNHLSADRRKKVIRRRMASRQDQDTLSVHQQQYDFKEYFLSFWLHVLARAQFWISSLKNLTTYEPLRLFKWNNWTYGEEEMGPLKLSRLLVMSV